MQKLVCFVPSSGAYHSDCTMPNSWQLYIAMSVLPDGQLIMTLPARHVQQRPSLARMHVSMHVRSLAGSHSSHAPPHI